MNEPIPCPFCGGELEEFEHFYFINHKNGCFLGTKEYRIRSIRKYNGRGKKSSYDIRKWNTRAERTCRYIGDDISGGCSECHGWLDPACSYCPSCGARVVEA